MLDASKPIFKDIKFEATDDFDLNNLTYFGITFVKQAFVERAQDLF